MRERVLALADEVSALLTRARDIEKLRGSSHFLPSFLDGCDEILGDALSDLGETEPDFEVIVEELELARDAVSEELGARGIVIVPG